MSIQDFLQQKTNGKEGKIPFQQPQLNKTTSSITDFLQRKDTPLKKTENEMNFGIEKTKPQKKPSKLKSFFQWTGKQLMKPSGIVAKEIRGVGEFTGHILSIGSKRVTLSEGLQRAAKAFGESQQGIIDVALGREETSLLKEMEKAGIEPTKFDKVMGIGADLILDPIWVAKPIKAAKQLGKLTKLDKPIKAGAKAISETEKFKQLKSLFTTTTGNKEFDTVVKKFRSLKEAREENLIDDAVKLQKDIKGFKKTGIKNAEELIVEGLENPASLVKADEKIVGIVNSLKTTYKTLLEQSKKVGLKIGEIEEYAPRIRTKESFLSKVKQEFGLGAREFGKGAVEKGRTAFKGMTQKEIREIAGGKYEKFFEKSPAIQLAKKGQMYAKAITSQEFAGAVKKFAVEAGQEVKHPVLKGLKFAPEQAKVIDNYYQNIKPEELKVIVRGFDKVQNLWKAQALVSPSYHIRNTVGNLWNNYIAGVNPFAYAKATALQATPVLKKFIDKTGYVKISNKMDNYVKGVAKEVNEMKKLGVINQGWYTKDIGEEVLKRVEGVGKWQTGINPLSQQNYLLQLNKKFGTVVENNARMAHYISKRAGGMSKEKAAESVKKFLFDYGDLTSFEKNVMKRFAPFYTWTKKNIPTQLEGMITQPAKYALPHKIIKQIESGVDVPNEKYMSPYITENIPVRIRTNKDGNTEYFLLGNWLPYASAIDVLSQPLETVVQMATPFLKVPIEQWANKSTFWKDTLGGYQEIERRYKQQEEFMGMSFRKKNVQLLRNIRILNDINKWIDKNDPTATKNEWPAKLMQTLIGRAGTYDVGKSKYFYDMDTQDRINELKQAIKDAKRRKFDDKAKKLRQELIDFQQMRR